MVKIIIPESKRIRRPRLELDIEIGELVFSTSHDVSSRTHLGALIGLEKSRDNDYLWLGHHFQLLPSQKFGGICVPLIEHICGGIEIDEYLIHFYVGQEQIVQTLQSWPGFEPHAELIAQMKKPYLE